LCLHKAERKQKQAILGLNPNDQIAFQRFYFLILSQWVQDLNMWNVGGTNIQPLTLL
jgi:hypothetical protein